MSATTRGLSTHFDAIIGTAITFIVLVTGTTILRIAAKLLIHAPFKFEDHLIFLAFAFYIVTEGLLIRGVTVGRHAETLNDSYDQYYTEFTFIYSIFYFAVMALCIASMSLVYRRVFRAKRHIQILAIIVLSVDLGWWISSTIVEIVAPIDYSETFPGNPRQSHLKINYLNWWFAAGVIEVAMTVVTILIPVSEIRKLRADGRKKTLLAVIFSVSFLCVATGIARLVTLYRPNNTYFHGRIGNVWINSHLGSAIMSANLPICWPIVSYRKQIVSFLKSGRSTKGDSKSGGSSRATFQSGISTAELDVACTVGTADTAARESGPAHLTEHDADMRDVEKNNHSRCESEEEINVSGSITATPTIHAEIKSPLDVYLRPG